MLVAALIRNVTDWRDLAAGHCGFGIDATFSAMANMQAFTSANGPSLKAFFVIPMVGSLFIDFFNAVIIAALMNYLKLGAGATTA